MYLYKDVLEKAQKNCADKKYVEEPVKFDDIRVSETNEKIFWFVFRAMCKIKRELKK